MLFSVIFDETQEYKQMRVWEKEKSQSIIKVKMEKLKRNHEKLKKEENASAWDTEWNLKNRRLGKKDTV